MIIDKTGFNLNYWSQFLTSQSTFVDQCFKENLLHDVDKEKRTQFFKEAYKILKGDASRTTKKANNV